MYRTGDLGRRDERGVIEFLGRVDHQVKVRGIRIEPGEIEATLRRYRGVQGSIVLVREDFARNQRLVGYVLAGDGSELTVQGITDHLKRNLPGYMVPSALIILDAWPLTSNGKLDRNSLPAPSDGRDRPVSDAVGPRTPVEEKLVAIFAEALNRQSVGVHDDLFDLGGHSLLAAQIMSRVRGTFRKNLPLRKLFEWPTVAGLAQAIDSTIA
jgi:acyl carrier protein